MIMGILMILIQAIAEILEKTPNHLHFFLTLI